MKVPRQARVLTRTLRQRSVACVLLVAHLLGATGLAFPGPAGKPHDTSIPYPCMARACGCTSAAECWRGCCCFSKEYRRAWFREHDINPATLEDAPPAETPPDDATECCPEGSCPEHGSGCPTCE